MPITVLLKNSYNVAKRKHSPRSATVRKKSTSLNKIIISAFFFLYLILPNYFALEFSEALPLLTASRFLILLLTVIVVFQRKGRLKRGIKDKGYIVFILILGLVNIVNMSESFGPSLKTVTSLILEYYFLTYLILSLVDTEEKINIALTAMVYASILVGILGAFETVSGVNVFYYLTTTKRDMLQSQYFRYGALRASGPFGHAVYFGNYAVCMLPFSLYLYDIKKKPIFFVAFLINIVSVLLSGSRASVVFLILLLLYIWIKKRGKDTRKYNRNLLLLIPIAVIVFLAVPNVMDMALTVIESSIGALTQTSTERANSLVGNANPLLSRLEQWAGLLWTVQNGKTIFGFGNNAHMEGMISYMVDGIWARRRTFDVGFVAIFCQYGIVGSIAYFILYFTRLKKTVEYKNKLKSVLMSSSYTTQIARLLNLQTTFHIFYIGYLIHLLSSVGVEEMLVLIISLQISANRICNKIISDTGGVIPEKQHIHLMKYRTMK